MGLEKAKERFTRASQNDNSIGVRENLVTCIPALPKYDRSGDGLYTQYLQARREGSGVGERGGGLVVLGFLTM